MAWKEVMLGDKSLYQVGGGGFLEIGTVTTDGRLRADL